MSRGRRLICLAGISGAGKDAAGAHLAAAHGFERAAIADPLKHAMARLFDLDEAQLWGSLRNVVDPRLGRAPRELYQRFGRACVEIDPEVWLRPFRSHVEATLARGGKVVCTDLRTPAELGVARAMGGVVWLVTRPGAGAPGALAADATELLAASLGRGDVDEVLANSGTLAELHAAISAALARDPRWSDEAAPAR
jgi:hypothetical protein